MKNFLPAKLWIRLVIVLIILLVLGSGSFALYQKYLSKDDSNKTTSNQSRLETKTADGVAIPPLPVDRPMKIAINEAKAENGKLHVAITVENRGHLGFGKLIYYASLVGKSEETKLSEGNILVLKPMPIAQINSASFPLPSGKVEQFQFDLNYPKGAPVGEYDLNVEVRPIEDTYYAFETQKVSLTGSGSNLTIPSYQGCRIKVGSTTYDSFSPVISPNETVNAECDVTNSGKQTTKAKPLVIYAKRSELRGGEVKTIDNLQEISLSPNEKKTVQFSLPPQSTPQIYEAQIQFVGEDTLPLSNIGFVRYVVKGPSPFVQKAELSTSTISKKDLVSLNVQVSPSGDIFYNGTTTEGTILKQPKLTAKLTSGDSITCAEKIVDLPANATTWKDEVKIDFKAESDCWDPILTLKINEAGQELTTFQKQYLSSVNQLTKPPINNQTLIMALSTVIFLIIIIIILILIIKKKKSPTNPVVKLLIFFALTALFFSAALFNQTANADITVGPGGQIGVTRGGTGPYTVTYNSSSSLTQTSPSNVHVFWGADVAAPSQWWYMSDKVRNFVNGGQVGPDYNFTTQNTGNGHQNVDHHYDVAASGGQTVMSRLYAVMVGPCCSEQANSGSGTNGDGQNNNCGSSQPCYGQLTLNVPVPCSPSTQTTTAACPAGQWGTVYLRNDYICPGQYWTGWYESPPRNCTQPWVTLSASPTSAYSPQTVTLSWSTGGHASGVTCSNNWAGAMAPNGGAGSTALNEGVGYKTYTISCSDGYSATANANILAAPPPGLSLNSVSCAASTSNISLRLTAPNIGLNSTIKLLRDNVLIYTSPLLSPGQAYDVTNASFTAPYGTLVPGMYATYSAIATPQGKSDSAATAIGVTHADCPSAPTPNAIAPFCSGNMPYINMDYVDSTYGNPSSYHIDRNGAYYTTIPRGTHPFQDAGILNNTGYSYTMRANNGWGTSVYSGGISTTSPNCTPPTVSIPQNTCTGSNPVVTINITAPGNAGAYMNYWLDLVSPSTANLAIRPLNPGAGVNVAHTEFNAPYNTLQSLTTYTVRAYSYGNGYSPYGTASFTTLECNGPKPFTLSVNAAAAAVCPADGLPKLNAVISKSANADLYDIYVRGWDGAGYNTVIANDVNIPTNTLFPGAPVAQGTGSATRTYTLPTPNINYGVYVVAKKSSTGSWIYSNWSTMNTGVPQQASDTTPWIYTNPGYCDTYPPQITLMNLMQDCYQPDTWTAAQPMRTLVQDLPRPGAPANSVSGVRDVYYSLDPQGTTNWSYLATFTAPNYYDRTFTPANFTSGANRYYSLGARATDRNNNIADITKKDFLYTNICTGWIQTRGGNVHSEGNINTPGGPQ